MRGMRDLRSKGGQRRYFQILLALWLLFLFRVLAQGLQKWSPVEQLPAFDRWYSGVLGYEWLLSTQFVILFLMAKVVARFRAGVVTPDRRYGQWLLAMGAVYFGVMLVRLMLGLTIAGNHPWLGMILPAVFHLVLALFLLVMGHFHVRHSASGDPTYMKTSLRRLGTWLAYPGVLLLSVWLFYRLQQNGVSAVASSYWAAVFGGVGLITVLEYLLPFRSDWRPSRTEIRVDLIFMILVQVLLPKALVLLTAIGLANWVEVQHFALGDGWPHALPVWAQMLLMMVIADFFRYWLHRAAHEWKPLWRFHAVHHSVDKLYWLNVGRFHPVDKSLQFLCDALPFILLGVTGDVLALYFVVYSIKGFYQHSNVDVKLGPLNYLISGPELHRWHHSKQVAESNKNYGNNLIIWDIVFGTFFLPRHKVVDGLGLQHAYPTGFLDQLRIPFKKPEASPDVV